MDDLDSLFAGELASIDQVFQEFRIKDKKTEQRNQTEKEGLDRIQEKAVVRGGWGEGRGGVWKGGEERVWWGRSYF